MWQELLFSYNIAVDRSEEMKRILGKSAASVGLQLPEVYRSWWLGFWFTFVLFFMLLVSYDFFVLCLTHLLPTELNLRFYYCTVFQLDKEKLSCVGWAYKVYQWKIRRVIIKLYFVVLEGHIGKNHPHYDVLFDTCIC